MTVHNLISDRLILRRPVPDELDLWTAFFCSERAKFVGGGTEGKRDLAWRVFATFLGHWAINGTGPFSIVLEADCRPIGMAGPWFPSGWPEKELTWSIWSQEDEGNGFATEAVQRLRAHVFQDLGWDRAVSYIDPSNAPSIALAERLDCTLDNAAPAPHDDDTLVYVHPR